MHNTEAQFLVYYGSRVVKFFESTVIIRRQLEAAIYKKKSGKFFIEISKT